MTTHVPHLMLLALLLLLSAFFSGCETAIFSLSKIEKRRLMINHPFVWKTVSRLLDLPRRTLVTILIGNMFVNTMAAAIATMIALDWFGPQGVGLTIAVFTWVIVLLSELMPKVFAVQHNVHFALFTAIPLDLVARIIYPIRRVVRWVADCVLSVLVQEKKSEADLVSEAELRALARIGDEEGALRGEEGEMIERLIKLGDRMVREIMVPRTELVAFDIDDGPEQLVEMVKKYHFTYVPVYEKSIDKLLGIISTQKFMLDPTHRIKELIEPTYYIPETKPIDEVLRDFQTETAHVAVCVDEHGGTAGIVTLEDVLEEIFGEFYDEYAKEEKLVRRIGKFRYLVRGKIGLHELEKEINITLASETSETLNGWLLERFGKIPVQNEVFNWEHIDYRVRTVSQQKIEEVEILKKKR